MMKKKISVLMLCIMLAACLAGTGFAKDQIATPVATPQMEQGQQIVVKGKVSFAQRLGGYFINGRDPAGEFMIVNQNQALLKGLLKSKKNVTIDGHLRGADFLFIEKINGRPYKGTPAVK
jgi:hypothetical protein